MAYIRYYKLWESEFHNNDSAKDRVQDVPLNQIKLNVNGTYKKDEKITTNFEASDPNDVINKGSLDKQ